MIRKATIVVCIIVAAGMTVLGIIRPETPDYQLWLGDGFLFVTIQRDLESTATWAGVEGDTFPGFAYGRIHAMGGQDTLILGVATWALVVLFGFPWMDLCSLTATSKAPFGWRSSRL